ncbi:DUF6470 family protein [Bacillus tianshenii]|nr:DUF6470 family protein [Bacillus tianshenii]
MQLPRLEIQTEQAHLGMNQRRANIEIRQHHADIQLKQPHADVKIHQKHGKIKIDQSAAFADANLKGIFQRIKEWTQKKTGYC